jgi:hypothetical protein
MLRRPAILPIALALWLLSTAALAQEPAVVTIQTPESVPAAGQTFNTDVTVDGVEGLLGFQFDVNFDPQAFSVQSIDLGPFLGSTGRSPQPLGPDTRDAANGRVVYGGFTLGQPDQEGAAGSGVLATITWEVLQPADFQATLSRIQLAGSGGRALPGSDPVEPPPVASSADARQPAAQPEAAAPAAEPASAPAESQPAQVQAGIPLWVWLVLIVVAVAVVAILVARQRTSGQEP